MGEIVVELIGWERSKYIPLAGDLARHNAKHYGFLLLDYGQGGARQGTPRGMVSRVAADIHGGRAVQRQMREEEEDDEERGWVWS
jgi:hypothetical protein